MNPNVFTEWHCIRNIRRLHRFCNDIDKKKKKNSCLESLLIGFTDRSVKMGFIVSFRKTSQLNKIGLFIFRKMTRKKGVYAICAYVLCVEIRTQ